MAANVVFPIIRATDANGEPSPGALLYTYESGTTTPQSVYLDDALTTEAEFPVVADAEGRFAPLFAEDGVTYKFVIMDADDATVIDEVDPWSGGKRGVQYDREQDLTEEEKTQARENIGAGDLAFTDDNEIAQRQSDGSYEPPIMAVGTETPRMTLKENLLVSTSLASRDRKVRRPDPKGGQTVYYSGNFQAFFDGNITTVDFQTKLPDETSPSYITFAVESTKTLYDIPRGVDGVTKVTQNGTDITVYCTVVDREGTTANQTYVDNNPDAELFIKVNTTTDGGFDGGIEWITYNEEGEVVSTADGDDLRVWPEGIGKMRLPSNVVQARANIRFKLPAGLGEHAFSLYVNNTSVGFSKIAGTEFIQNVNMSFLIPGPLDGTEVYRVDYIYELDTPLMDEEEPPQPIPQFTGPYFWELSFDHILTKPNYPRRKTIHFQQGPVLQGGQTIQEAAAAFASYDCIVVSGIYEDYTTGATPGTQTWDGVDYALVNGFVQPEYEGMLETVLLAKSINPNLIVLAYLPGSAGAPLGTSVGQSKQFLKTGPGPHTLDDPLVTLYSESGSMNVKMLIGPYQPGYYKDVDLVGTETIESVDYPVYSHTIDILGTDTLVTYKTGSKEITFDPDMADTDEIIFQIAQDYSKFPYTMDEDGLLRIDTLCDNIKNNPRFPFEGVFLDLMNPVTQGTANLEASLNRFAQNMPDDYIGLNLLGYLPKDIINIFKLPSFGDNMIAVAEGFYLRNGELKASEATALLTEARALQKEKNFRMALLLSDTSYAGSEISFTGNVETAVNAVVPLLENGDFIGVQTSDLMVTPRPIPTCLEEIKP